MPSFRADPDGHRKFCRSGHFRPRRRTISGMNSPHSESSSSPTEHSENIRRQLTELIEHLQADTRRVDEARFKALLEKSAEVLKGLRTLFERYDQLHPARSESRSEKSDRASRKDSRPSEGEKMGKPASSKTEAKPARAVTSGGGKKSEDRSSSPAPKSRPSGGKESGSSEKSPAAVTAGSSSTETAAPAPIDPDEIAARARLQRQEARAPKRPGGHAAPKPMPPKSGKPVWRRPHSS